MYLSHFGLSKNPFLISTDPHFLWLGEKHKEALAVLRYGILDDRGCVLLTGDVGTGKTTLIHALLEDLGEKIVPAVIHDPGLSRQDLFLSISKAYGIENGCSSKSSFLITFEEYLYRQEAEGKKALLIIDEAQRLNSFLLEEIRLLSNIEKPDAKLLTIFFVGQDEFHKLLLDERNRAIRQRITIRYHMEPLNPEEVRGYVHHRLQVAGAQRDLFSQEALAEIYSLSKGCPRRINIICDQSLLTAYVKQEDSVSAETVTESTQGLKIEAKEAIPEAGVAQFTAPPEVSEPITANNISESLEPVSSPPAHEPIGIPASLEEEHERLSEPMPDESPEQPPPVPSAGSPGWGFSTHRWKIPLILGLVLIAFAFIRYYPFSAVTFEPPSREKSQDSSKLERKGNEETKIQPEETSHAESTTAPDEGNAQLSSPQGTGGTNVVPAEGRSRLEEETFRKGAAEVSSPPPTAEPPFQSSEESQIFDIESLEETDCATALQAMERALRKTPANERLWFFKGNCHSSLGEEEEAIGAYKRAISLKPDYADAHYRLGMEYRLIDLHEQALISLKSALALRPEDSETYYQIGSTYEDRGNFEEAIEMLREAVAFDPSHMRAYSTLARIYRNLGRLEEEMDVYNEILRVEPLDFNAHFNRGVTYMKLGDNQSAIDAFKQALKIGEEYPMTYYLLGRCYLLTGDRKKALQQYETLTAHSPDMAEKLQEEMRVSRHNEEIF